MKKKCGYIFVAVVLLLAAAFVWWNRETTFLSSITAEEVSAVAVRDGHTGKIFEVTAEEEIAYIVREIKSASFHREGLSLFRMGTWFTLSFLDEQGDVAREIIVNGAQTIRKDPFFYQTETGNLQNLIDYFCATEESAA